LEKQEETDDKSFAGQGGAGHWWCQRCGSEGGEAASGEGAKVAFSDINEAAGQQLAAELGEGSMFVRHDVSSEADWTLVMAAVQRRLGTLNVLVNNAGILLPGDMETGRLEDFSRLLKINTESVFIGCQQGIAAMKEAGGSIINMASISSWLPVSNTPAIAPARLPCRR
jgi:3(or 17)beta-hydroxysteroid dehydrogenase